MAGMEWVMEEDDSDKTFMKEYRMRDVVGDIKKRVNDLQKMERSHKFNWSPIFNVFYFAIVKFKYN